MKKYFLVLVTLIFILTACQANSPKQDEVLPPRQEGLLVKEKWEKQNTLKTEQGELRSLTIEEYNPFIEISLDTLCEKIQAKESLIVLFATPSEQLSRIFMDAYNKIAKDLGPADLYIVDLKDEKGNDLRDVFTVDEQGLPKIEEAAADGYYNLLSLVDTKLPKYIVNEVDIGEGRIEYPAIMSIKNGDLDFYVDITSYPWNEELASIDLYDGSSASFEESIKGSMYSLVQASTEK